MVILDELCSGTNPSEGEEIFELVDPLPVMTQAQIALSAAACSEARHIIACQLLSKRSGIAYCWWYGA